METWKFGGVLGHIYVKAWRPQLKINRFVTSSDESVQLLFPVTMETASLGSHLLECLMFGTKTLTVINLYLTPPPFPHFPPGGWFVNTGHIFFSLSGHDNFCLHDFGCIAAELISQKKKKFKSKSNLI